jgi:hypothetical protein
MTDDHVQVLRQVLSAHRAMVEGALQVAPHVDIARAYEIHAGLSRLLARWDSFNTYQQREIVRTIEYVVNSDDEQPDFAGPDGFQDDLIEFERLKTRLGYL